MLEYNDFRSGLTFAEVRAELLGEQDTARRAGSYMFVTRATVLGRWRQHKLAAYAYYLNTEGLSDNAYP